MIGIFVIDLFCGVGGLIYGFEKVGFFVNVGYDIDFVCKFFYEYNNKVKFILKSVEDIESMELVKYFLICYFKVLVGCFLC